MINASRFSTFSKTQNLGLANISAIKDSEILNTVTNKLKSVSQDLNDLGYFLAQDLLPEGVSVEDVRETIDESIRVTKDAFSVIKDISKFSIRDIENEIASMLPNDPTLQNAFRNLTASCRDSSLSKSSGFKPFDDTASCGNPGDGKCQSGEVSGFFNKLTGGVIGEIGRTMQSMLNSLITLGNLGYSGSLCKIFATLANGLPGSVIQRGASLLLATTGSVGNTTAVMDIAANMGNSNPSAEIPGLATKIAENFTIPKNFDSSTYSSLYIGYTAALGFIQTDADKNVYGNNSIAYLGKKNTALAAVASSFSKSNYFTDMDTPIGGRDTDLAVAYCSKDYSESLDFLLD